MDKCSPPCPAAFWMACVSFPLMAPSAEQRALCEAGVSLGRGQLHVYNISINSGSETLRLGAQAVLERQQSWSNSARLSPRCQQDPSVETRTCFLVALAWCDGSWDSITWSWAVPELVVGQRDLGCAKGCAKDALSDAGCRQHPGTALLSPGLLSPRAERWQQLPGSAESAGISSPRRADNIHLLSRDTCFRDPLSPCCESVPGRARNPLPWRLAVLTHPLWPQQSEFCFFFILLQARKCLVLLFFSPEGFGPRQVLWGWWLSCLYTHQEPQRGIQAGQVSSVAKKSEIPPINANEASLLHGGTNISPNSPFLLHLRISVAHQGLLLL